MTTHKGDVRMSLSRTRTCSWCGNQGHDRRSCTVTIDARSCSACGYHGHDRRSCSHA